MGRYSKALRPVIKVNDEAAARSSAPRKVGLRIGHLESALLLPSEKQNPPLSVETAAVPTEDNTREKKHVVLLSCVLFVCCPAPGQDKKRPQEAFAANESIFEKFLSSQMPRTKSSSLSVETMFLSIMSLLSVDL